MASELDALVVGGDVASAAAAAALADAGRRVALLRPSVAPSPASGLVSGRALGRAPAWARGLPIDRALSGRTVLLLDRKSAVSLDYRDASWVAGGARDGLASGSAWVRALEAMLEAKGAEVLRPEAEVLVDRDASGRVVGALGRTAKITLLAGPLGGAPSPSHGSWWSLRRRYTLAAERVSARLGVAPAEGPFWECVLGFLPSPARGAGYLCPTSDAILVGVTLEAPEAPPAVARSTLDALVAHPAIAPVVAGAVAAEEVLAPSVIGGSPGTPESGAGFLALGVPASGGFTTVAGAPSLDRELARGLAAGAAVATAIAGGSDGPGALARYRALLRTIERSAARSSVGLALNPRAAAEYPRLSAHLLHELLHESGRPKEPVAEVVRRVRKSARRSWLRLSADALELARSV